MLLENMNVSMLLGFEFSHLNICGKACMLFFFFFLEFLEHFIFCNVTCRVFNNIAHNLTVVFHGCATHNYVVDKCVHKLITI